MHLCIQHRWYPAPMGHVLGENQKRKIDDERRRRRRRMQSVAKIVHDLSVTMVLGHTHAPTAQTAHLGMKSIQIEKENEWISFFFFSFRRKTTAGMRSARTKYADARVKLHRVAVVAASVGNWLFAAFVWRKWVFLSQCRQVRWFTPCMEFALVLRSNFMKYAKHLANMSLNAIPFFLASKWVLDTEKCTCTHPLQSVVAIEWAAELIFLHFSLLKWNSLASLSLVAFFIAHLARRIKYARNQWRTSYKHKQLYCLFLCLIMIIHFLVLEL